MKACPPQADIAFLLDGSISVSSRDFQTMKKFVKDLIQSFLSIDAQVRHCSPSVKDRIFAFLFPFSFTILIRFKYYFFFFCCCSFLFPSSHVHRRFISILRNFPHLDQLRLTLMEYLSKGEPLTLLRPSDILCKGCHDITEALKLTHCQDCSDDFFL